MRIKLTDKHRTAIALQAERTYPHECCGLLLGRELHGAKVVEDLWPCDNAWVESPQNRSLIPSEQVLQCDREARARGLEIIGFYHSHPNVPARPSEFDREHALPWWSYIIISVQNGKVAELRSWRLRDDRSQFDQEEIFT
ncbi:MAG: M67 family metallopeptidase [Acidobacteriota bacterium]|nr:M67 family metallopeptidase [Blastocatellia bacterium]MDW8240943.1 M67 family metallopeptidase [Acidobacteriota bacterium]